MHNGQISDFTLIKRRLQNNLSEELFLHPSGYTGSSHRAVQVIQMLTFAHYRLGMGIRVVPVQGK